MNEIDLLIKKAVVKVKKEQPRIPKDIHERSFVFRFGHYLANEIENNPKYKGYTVDVEYNRIKETEIKANDENVYIIPDLIVHKRGINDNLIAIEFKKNNNSKKDKERLAYLKTNSDYRYINVYFIIINKNIIEKYNGYQWEKLEVIYDE